MNTKEATENLYTVFSKYTTSNMHYCDCGCIDETDVKKLASKKLRALNEDDYSSYHGSALYTWGEIEHYKHFLPRIFEVHHQQKGKGVIGLFEIIAKLEYAKWETWSEIEINAINEFILTDWNNYVNKVSVDIGINDLEHYSYFIAPHDLLHTWHVTKNGISLKNFIHFFYSNSTYLLDKGLKLKGKFYDIEFKEFINQSGLMEALVKEFFSADEMDKEYAGKISVVTQLLEQEKMVNKKV